MTDWIVWIAAGLGLLILDLLLPGVFMLSLSLAACGVGLLTLALDFDLSGQVVAFGILAAIALTVGLHLRRPAKAGHTERQGLVGQPATALVFQGRDGRVHLGDADWSARVPPGFPPPEPGARLRVAQVDGTILIVRPDF